MGWETTHAHDRNGRIDDGIWEWMEVDVGSIGCCVCVCVCWSIFILVTMYLWVGHPPKPIKYKWQFDDGSYKWMEVDVGSNGCSISIRMCVCERERGGGDWDLFQGLRPRTRIMFEELYDIICV